MLSACKLVKICCFAGREFVCAIRCWYCSSFSCDGLLVGLFDSGVLVHISMY